MFIRYSIADVFTKSRFSGNQVAVIHDASGLSDDTMQAIAREFGFSESTFVLPPTDAVSTARVRIFTPFEEVAFAGHPNIGTAFVIANEDTGAKDTPGPKMLFEELGGAVKVSLMVEDGATVGAEIVAPQPLHVLGEVDAGLTARCLGLSKDAILTGRMEPCVASVGLPFAFIELRDLDSLASIVPDIPAFRDARDIGPATVDGFSICAFVVCDDTDDRMVLRTRVFSPLGHPPEDPATGSASGALGALLARSHGNPARKYRLFQGVEMGRPSEIDVEIVAADQPPTIKGYCVQVCRGEFLI